MDAAKKAEMLKRVMTSKVSQAQKREEPKGPSDRPVQDKGKTIRSTTAGKSLSALAQLYKDTHPERVKASCGVAGTVAKRPASVVRPVEKDKVFRPDWSILRTDTAIGNPEIAREHIRKGVLEKDAKCIEKEVLETAFRAGFASIYQLGCYWTDLEGKSMMFSQTLTSVQEGLGQANKDNEQLLTKLRVSRDARKILTEENAHLKNAQEEQIWRALDD
ncbi:uncharacterized protein LOC143856513 isoform X1 [Tasmannia lanceolata]|uniref:uncharacterized protein LOC143856513 isoform X1 n=1 Tax=Tasmannia lanceolata TaxID=3420 RepID=UPI004062D09A